MLGSATSRSRGSSFDSYFIFRNSFECRKSFFIREKHEISNKKKVFSSSPPDLRPQLVEHKHSVYFVLKINRTFNDTQVISSNTFLCFSQAPSTADNWIERSYLRKQEKERRWCSWGLLVIRNANRTLFNFQLESLMSGLFKLGRRRSYCVYSFNGLCYIVLCLSLRVCVVEL